MVSLALKKDSPEHNRIRDRLMSRLQIAEKANQRRHEKWAKAEDTTLAYVPETEENRLRRAKRDQGSPQYTTIHIPYSYALLMSAHTYWTSVFFARQPVHQVSGRHGESEMQTQAMEALLDYQVQVGNFLGPYYIWLYDAGKYGVGWIGTYWEYEETYFSQIIIDPNTGRKVQGRYKRPGYMGNKVYNLSPYDAYPDPRVPVNRFQDGEFFAALRRISWAEVKKREAQGYYVNVEHLVRHASMPPNSWGSSQLERPDNDESSDIYVIDYNRSGNQEKHPAMVAVYEVHVNLIPMDWGLGDSDMPEKWCFTITYDKGLVMGAEPLGSMHDKFPFDVLETEVEGYGLWNRGLPEIMEPIQQTIDWLINSHFFNVRAALNNQFVFDPSRIYSRDVEKGGPGFAFRLRPEAYGTDVRTAYSQVPVADVTRGHMADVAGMTQWGERISGISDQIMGMLGGSRKTATEVRTSTSFGVNRLKTISEYMSATGFSPHAQKLIQNSQQFYDVPMKLKLVGDQAKMAGEKFMMVNQQDIQGFYDFVPVDGTLPVDRFAQVTLWKDIFATVSRMPEIAMRYDLGKMFGWVAQLAGLKNIQQFEIILTPDQMLMQQAQAGNVVPMRPPGGGPATQGPTTTSGNNNGTNQYGN